LEQPEPEEGAEALQQLAEVVPEQQLEREEEEQLRLVRQWGPGGQRILLCVPP